MSCNLGLARLTMRDLQEGNQMKTGLAILAILVGVVGVTGCGKCSPAAPTASATAFGGTVPEGGVVFHDLSVPNGTDSIDALVQWTTAADLRLIQIP